MASTLRIMIEPLLRSIRPRRCQFWKILFTLSRQRLQPYTGIISRRGMRRRGAMRGNDLEGPLGRVRGFANVLGFGSAVTCHTNAPVSLAAPRLVG
jgi:hypothetical protein